MLCGAYFFARLARREFAAAGRFALWCFFALALAVGLFPWCLNHIFGGYRGKGAMESAAALRLSDMCRWFKILWQTLDAQQFGGLLLALVCVGAALAFWPLKKAGQGFLRGAGLSAAALLACAAYVLVIAVVSPYKVDRYIFCVYPLATVALFMLFARGGCRFGSRRGSACLLACAVLAACGAEGETVICNAAREPEIADLQDFLCAMGAEVRGAGGSVITVSPKRPLHGCVHRVIPDRIVAATYLCAAAAAGGEVTLRNAEHRHLAAVTTVLDQAGCGVRCGEGYIQLVRTGPLRAVPPVRTAPYPGFPTDCQAILMAALLRAQGTTVFVENIFQSRYRHVPELARMGADIRTEGRVAVVCGTERLHGTEVVATDLRGGAALAVAGLAAEGMTTVQGIGHIQRGYADLAGDLRALGAQITAQ